MKVCKGSLQEVLVQRSCQIPSIRSFFDDCVKFSLRSWLEVLEFLFTDVFLNAVRAFLPSYGSKNKHAPFGPLAQHIMFPMGSRTSKNV